MADEARTPNLFILGAPKCGTTAMSHYLAGHPDIFMSEQAGDKEPRFFCSDDWSPVPRKTNSWSQYLNLYREAPCSTRFLGDATTVYLRSEDAVPEILRTCRDPRFVVMLRNPIDLAVSLHNQRIKNNWETIFNFEAAWRLQAERWAGKRLPYGVPDGRYLNYEVPAMLGRQMNKLTQLVEKRKIYWIFYEDFQHDPGACYRKLLAFLDLADDGRSDFAVRNSSTVYKWPYIQKLLSRLGHFRRALGLRGFGLATRLSKINSRKGRKVISKNFERELQQHFEADIRLLSRVTGRDLSHWLLDVPATQAGDIEIKRQ